MRQDDNPLPPEDQQILIQRVKAGEVELFSTLVQPHEKSLRLTCYSVLQNDADAEEVVQEALLKALGHLHQLREGQCFRGWLFQIAINEARRRVRRDRIYQWGAGDLEKTTSEEGEVVPQDFADWRQVPSLEIERKELWSAVCRALRSIDPIYREVFVLRDMQQLTALQASLILGISEACVTTRLHRARRQMRQQLAPLFRLGGEMSAPAKNLRTGHYAIGARI